MIDVHCHILPEVDDGSDSWEESFDIIRMEISGGTKGFITTPHVLDSPDLNRVSLFQARLTELRIRLVDEGIALELYPGAEVYPFPAAIKAIDDGVPLTMAGSGKYVLVDTPFSQMPHDFDTFIFDLRSRGITPILAHPERSTAFQSDPARMIECVRLGAVLQVNAGSLKDRYGPVANSFAQRLLARRMAHFVASDTHRPSRAPTLGTFRDSQSEALGTDYVNLLTTLSPRAVVEGRPLPDLPEAPSEPDKGWLHKTFGRDKNPFTF